MTDRVIPVVIAAAAGAALTLFLTGIGAGGGSAGPSSTGLRSAAGDTEVLARVDGEAITRAEVRDLQAEEHLQLDRSRQELFEAGLQQAIRDRLVELEAADRGMSEEELLAEEVESQVSDPTDAEVDLFYAENRDRLRGTREQLDGPIRQFLRQQSLQADYEVFIANLERKFEVESYLEPFRFEVADAGHPAKGPEAAPVTIVEFSDFECPFCLRIVPTLDRILEDYGDDVRLVFRQFPLNNIHPNAQRAAEASLCAADQSEFWTFHDALFAEPGGLDRESLTRTAADLGLDVDAFSECLDSRRHGESVEADLEAGRLLGVTGTPALFINGRFLSGAQPYEVISAIIDDELGRAAG